MQMSCWQSPAQTKALNEVPPSGLMGILLSSAKPLKVEQTVALWVKKNQMQFFNIAILTKTHKQTNNAPAPSLLNFYTYLCKCS